VASFANRHNIEEGIPEHEERITFVFVISNTEVISGGTMTASNDKFLIQGILVSLPHSSNSRDIHDGVIMVDVS
jgi:hypothetical protein